MKNFGKILLLAILLATGVASCSMDEKKNNNQTDTTRAGANDVNGASNHDTLHIDTASKADSVRETH